jgi:hypothetical protein
MTWEGLQLKEVMRHQCGRPDDRRRAALERLVADLDWGLKLLRRGHRLLQNQVKLKHALPLLRAGARQVIVGCESLQQLDASIGSQSQQMAGRWRKFLRQVEAEERRLQRFP